LPGEVELEAAEKEKEEVEAEAEEEECKGENPKILMIARRSSLEYRRRTKGKLNRKLNRFSPC
jgi:hypothetical protein